MDRNTSKEKSGMARRDFLKLGAITGAAAMMTATLPRVSFGAVKPASLDRIMAMTPVQMANESKIVQENWEFLQRSTAMIKNLSVRKIVEGILANPAPTFAAPLQDASAKKAVFDELTGQGYLSVTIDQFLPPTQDPLKSVQPFYSAPGSGYSSHHAYPGGLVAHVALNTDSSLGLFGGYGQVDNTHVDQDTVVASSCSTIC